MEPSVIIWIVIIGWLVIYFAFNFYRDKVREGVAHEILDGKFNYLKEKEEVLSINKKLGFVRTENSQPITASPSIFRCPSCNGKLIQRRSQYGAFLGCSNYPRCKVKKTIR